MSDERTFGDHCSRVPCTDMTDERRRWEELRYVVVRIVLVVLGISLGAAIAVLLTWQLRHILALVIVAAFSFIGSLILYKVTDLIIPLRVTHEQEEEGLDLSQHGETALGADLLGGAHANGQAPIEMPVGSGV